MLQQPDLLSQGFNVDIVVSKASWSFWFDGLCPNGTTPVPRPHGQFNELTETAQFIKILPTKSADESPVFEVIQ